MSQILDLIKSQVFDSASGVTLPADTKDQVLGGLSDSILGGLKQTAASTGGIEQLTSLFTGKTAAAQSPVTAAAGKIFQSDVIQKLGLSPAIANAAKALIPIVIGKLVGKVGSGGSDGSGEGFDLGSLLSAVGGGSGDGDGSTLLKKAGSLLGGLFKK